MRKVCVCVCVLKLAVGLHSFCVAGDIHISHCLLLHVTVCSDYWSAGDQICLGYGICGGICSRILYCTVL